MYSAVDNRMAENKEMMEVRMKKIIYYIFEFLAFLSAIVAFYVVSGLDSCCYEISLLLILGQCMEKSHRYIGGLK